MLPFSPRIRIVAGPTPRCSCRGPCAPWPRPGTRTWPRHVRRCTPTRSRSSGTGDAVTDRVAFGVVGDRWVWHLGQHALPFRDELAGEGKLRAVGRRRPVAPTVGTPLAGTFYPPGATCVVM